MRHKQQRFSAINFFRRDGDSNLRSSVPNAVFRLHPTCLPAEQPDQLRALPGVNFTNLHFVRKVFGQLFLS
jgi:hypothetical protein